MAFDPEKIVQEYFYNNFGKFQLDYEPFGTDTFPDFRIGSVLVEVTQLDQKMEGVAKQSVQKSIEDSIFKLIKMYKDKDIEQGWYIYISFERPVCKKRFEEFLKDQLEEMSRRTSDKIVSFHGDNFELEFIPAKTSKTFGYGGMFDKDEGGWAIPVFKENFFHALSRKNTKLEKFNRENSKSQNKEYSYSLAFIDFDPYSEEDIEAFIQDEEIKQRCLSSSWNTIFLFHHEINNGSTTGKFKNTLFKGSMLPLNSFK